MDRGKQFENKFKEDWLKIEDSSIERFPDQVSGNFGTSRNPSDFVCYCYPYQYYIECKETKDNSYNFTKLRQYELLMERSGRKGIRSGLVIWYSSKDIVIYVPIRTISKLKEVGYKSIASNKINEYLSLGFKIINIPSKKLRVFMDSDYRVLLDLEEGD